MTSYTTDSPDRLAWRAAYRAPKPEITPALATLLHMLSFRRPAGSDTEEAFIDTFLRPLRPMEDAQGNLFLKNGDAPDIMFSCHTDSVHAKGGRQRLHLEGALAFAAHSSCLGADDAAGVWLCLQMYLAGVPGWYAFHREEEIGGGGSAYSAKRHDWSGVRACIALDRKGYGDVITHQGSSRCCSDAFAKSLAAILGAGYAPDDTGLFTDSANYTDVIGECTNLSVGYSDAHGPHESLDLAFIADLASRMIAADWSALTFSRKPGEFDPDDRWLGGGWTFGKGWAAEGSNASLWDRDGAYGSNRRSGGRGDFERLVELVRDYPIGIADLLTSYGLDADEVERELDAAVGAFRR